MNRFLLAGLLALLCCWPMLHIGYAQAVPDAETQAPSPDVTPDDVPSNDADDSNDDPAVEGGSPLDSVTLEELPVDSPATWRYRIEEHSLIAERLNAEQTWQQQWQLAFPDSFALTPVLEFHDSLYLAHGNSVLALDPMRGVVQRRWIVSGAVRDLRPADDNRLAATVTFAPLLTPLPPSTTSPSTTPLNNAAASPTLVAGQGVADRLEQQRQLARERIVLDVTAATNPSSSLRFGTDFALFHSLRQEAQLGNPAVRQQQDLSNPWLRVAVAENLSNPEAARAFAAAAVDSAQTFYDLAGLSQALYRIGHADLAEQAFEAALRDMVARGYHPPLIRDLSLAHAYNLPVDSLQQALADDALEDASFWADKLWRAAPALLETRQLLLRYADMQAANGNSDLAGLWRERARSGLSAEESPRLEQQRPLYPEFAGLPVAWHDSTAALLGLGWPLALVLLLVLLALHWVLLLKYWVVQGENLRDDGGSSLARLRLLRYYSLGEKFSLLLLFALLFSSVSLLLWYQHDRPLPLALRSGTLLSSEAQHYLRTYRLPALLEGYLAQGSGDTNRANEAYRSLPDSPAALNNLGVLTGTERYFRAALERDPTFIAARHNLGQQLSNPPFQAQYGQDQVLAVPDQQLLRQATQRRWQDALQALANPWQRLQSATPPLLSASQWRWLVAIMFALAGLTLLFVFVSRPRGSRYAPRSALYHVFSLLVPGSAVAYQLWGVVLLVAWGLLMWDWLAAQQGWDGRIVPALGWEEHWTLWGLAAVYALNLLAILIAAWGHRRQMGKLRQRTREAMGAR